MPDKEKTFLLKELTRTIDESDSTAAFCLCQRWILKDALALLKEQEAKQEGMPPTWQDRTQEHICQKCGGIVWQEDNYCSKCGQKVKWR